MRRHAVSTGRPDAMLGVILLLQTLTLAIAGPAAAPPVALLVPTSQAEIVKAVTDLPGTRVGLSSPGAPEQAWLGWLLARAGLTLAQIWVVSHGSRGLVAAVESGDVHAGLVQE